jgi:SAM-dependent methyltransferase
MISEFRRVLKPDGLFFVSTPNRLVQSPDGIVHNPYHTQEFTPDEFKALLEEQFSSVRLFGQEYIRYKDVKGFRWKLGQMIETMLYRRGLRKLPISLQDTLLRFFIGKPQYPEVQDYTMNADPVVLSKHCVTQFAICKP